MTTDVYWVLTSSLGSGILLLLYGFEEGLGWFGFLGGAILGISFLDPKDLYHVL